MKQIVAICFLCLVVIGCDNLGKNKEKDRDPSPESELFLEERGRQIENAKHNRALIPGRWKVVKIKHSKDAEYESIKMELKEMIFDTYEFLPHSAYLFRKGKKIIEKGTYEWMAEDRELVFTPANDSMVTRLLIWNINHKYMKASSKSSYMILKKLLDTTDSAKKIDVVYTSQRKEPEHKERYSRIEPQPLLP